MDWKKFISQLNSGNDSLQFGFNPPATKAELLSVAVHFELTELPNGFIELYQQSNGIDILSDHGIIGHLIWPIQRIIETNKEFRNNDSFKELYMSFDQLFFISESGFGDQFAFAAINGRFDRDDIFVWNHENDSRTWVAPNLERFIDWWANGKIKL